jgi:hypothetical protein
MSSYLPRFCHSMEILCYSLHKSVLKPNNKLNDLLPAPKEHSYSFRNPRTFPFIKCRTKIESVTETNSHFYKTVYLLLDIPSLTSSRSIISSSAFVASQRLQGKTTGSSFFGSSTVTCGKEKY